MANDVTTPLIVGLGGTNRDSSSSEKALRYALEVARQQGARIEIIAGAQLEMPTYGDGGVRSENAHRMLDLLRRSDGIIIASPSYHGTISGYLKNALDYVEDLRGDERCYFDNRAVGCIVCAYGWQAVGTTLTTMRSIVHALRGWPTPMGVGLNSALPLFDEAGDVIDQSARFQLELMVKQTVDFARWRQSVDARVALPAA